MGINRVFGVLAEIIPGMDGFKVMPSSEVNKFRASLKGPL